MQIHLKNIVPLPLADKDLSASDIWNRDVLFRSGEAIHIYAPSGSGKSTLLHILYGLRKDFTGAVQLDDKNLQHSPAHISSLRKNNISIVFQDMRLFAGLTAMENLMVKSSLTEHVQKETIKQMLSDLGVIHLEDKKAQFMSLGEQQRIAIIRALLQPFNWLLLDEPFSHLDTQNIEKAKEMIQYHCHKNNAGLIIASLGDTYDIEYNRNLNL